MANEQNTIQKQLDAAKLRVKDLTEKLRKQKEKRYLEMGKFIEEQEKAGWSLSIEDLKTKWADLNK